MNPIPLNNRTIQPSFSLFGLIAPLVVLCMAGLVSEAQDSVPAVQRKTEMRIAAASTQYANLPFYTKWLLGKNYRKAWETPVSLPVFHLSTSGFRKTGKGGGKQTSSLQLLDGNNQVWVLRSVEKDVRKGYITLIQATPVVPYKQNLISGTFPYGALVAASLMKAAGIHAPDPVYYHVAEDEALGEEGSLLVNSICMLERRDPTPDGSPAISTDSLKKKLKEGPAFQVDKRQVLKARIMDMFLGDPDRHAGQWRWGMKDSGNTKTFYAIPRDRDHVFFSSDGGFAFLLKFVFPYDHQSFSGNSGNLKQLNRKAYSFDETFLIDLTREDWLEAAQTVVSQMTDNVIDAAVEKLPSEVLSLDGEKLKRTLKERKTDFVVQVMEYHDFLFPKKPPY